MDATTKQRLRHAAELLGWIAEEQKCEFLNYNGIWQECLFGDSYDYIVNSVINDSVTYRLKPAKTRRPFTEQEARRLVGCVLVPPSQFDTPSVVRYLHAGKVVRHLANEPTFSELARDKWHYHLPGQPDNLLPCWVEE